METQPNEEEPDPMQREYRYCKAVEMILPHFMPEHDDFIDGLAVGESE